MIDEADAVVIGSGALGASTAFHLRKAGLRRVVLLDQHEIASQTSPRAAGLTQQVRNSELMTSLARRAVEKIRSFARDTGEDLAYVQSGSMKLARTGEHAQQLREEVARGQRLGVEIDLISNDEAQRLMPFLEPVGVTAISFARTDLYLEPGQVPRLYARSFARDGGTVLPHTRVQAIETSDGRVTGVVTDKGVIGAPVVVDAGGAWLRQVGASAGARAGVVAMRHQLYITEPIDGVEPTQPITRVIDCCVYIRPCDGGLMLGGYEADPLVLDTAERPPEFSIDDMPLDFDVLRRLTDEVLPLMPVLRDARVREHRGGLPTISADGEHIVGPWPGLAGLFLIGGCCVGGLSIAPAIGEILARWIATGEPGLDMSTMQPARTAVIVNDEPSLIERCRRRYAHHYWAEAD